MQVQCLIFIKAPQSTLSLACAAISVTMGLLECIHLLPPNHNSLFSCSVSALCEPFSPIPHFQPRALSRPQPAPLQTQCLVQEHPQTPFGASGENATFLDVWKLLTFSLYTETRKDTGIKATAILLSQVHDTETNSTEDRTKVRTRTSFEPSIQPCLYEASSNSGLLNYVSYVSKWTVFFPKAVWSKFLSISAKEVLVDTTTVYIYF